jgi:hypothetical protein
MRQKVRYRNRAIILTLFFQACPPLTVLSLPITASDVVSVQQSTNDDDNAIDDDNEMSKSTEHVELTLPIDDFVMALLILLHTKMKDTLSIDEQRKVCIEMHAKLQTFGQEKTLNRIISLQSKKEIIRLLDWNNYINFFSDEIYNTDLRTSLQKVHDMMFDVEHDASSDVVDANRIMQDVVQGTKNVVSLMDQEIVCYLYKEKMVAMEKRINVDIIRNDIMNSAVTADEIAEIIALIEWSETYEQLLTNQNYQNLLKYTTNKLRNIINNVIIDVVQIMHNVSEGVTNELTKQERRAIYDHYVTKLDVLQSMTRRDFVRACKLINEINDLIEWGEKYNILFINSNLQRSMKTVVTEICLARNSLEEKLASIAPLDYAIADTKLVYSYDFERFEKRVYDLFLWFTNRDYYYSFIAPSFSFVQSSGTGKTQLLYWLEQVINGKLKGTSTISWEDTNCILLLCQEDYVHRSDIHKIFNVRQFSAESPNDFCHRLDSFIEYFETSIEKDRKNLTPKYANEKIN